MHASSRSPPSISASPTKSTRSPRACRSCCSTGPRSSPRGPLPSKREARAPARSSSQSPPQPHLRCTDEHHHRLLYPLISDLRTTLLPSYPAVLAQLLALLPRAQAISAETLARLMHTLGALWKWVLVPALPAPAGAGLLRATWDALAHTLARCAPEVQRALAEVWGAGVLRRLKADAGARRGAVEMLAACVRDGRGMEDLCAWSLVYACQVRLDPSSLARVCADPLAWLVRNADTAHVHARHRRRAARLPPRRAAGRARRRGRARRAPRAPRAHGAAAPLQNGRAVRGRRRRARRALRAPRRRPRARRLGRGRGVGAGAPAPRDGGRLRGVLGAPGVADVPCVYLVLPLPPRL